MNNFPLQKHIIVSSNQTLNWTHQALCLCMHHYTHSVSECTMLQCTHFGRYAKKYRYTRNHLCTNSRCINFFQLVKQAAAEHHRKEAQLYSFLCNQLLKSTVKFARTYVSPRKDSQKFLSSMPNEGNHSTGNSVNSRTVQENQ